MIVFIRAEGNFLRVKEFCIRIDIGPIVLQYIGLFNDGFMRVCICMILLLRRLVEL